MKRTLIRNALVYNTWLRRFLLGWVLLEGERVRYAFCEGAEPDTADETIDAKGCYCIPSLIDIHLHVESSMITPGTFSRELLRHGVTTCIAEPHEIANVFGLDGVKAFIRAGREAEMDILWGIPSSVPCTEFETTGGRIELDVSGEEERGARQALREQTRTHRLAMDGNPSSKRIAAHYRSLDRADQDKDWKPFNNLLLLLKKFDGLRIYRL